MRDDEADSQLTFGSCTDNQIASFGVGFNGFFSLSL